MKPPGFEYAAPTTVEEALALVREGGGDARFLAGGQSLVPLLNMRFARPERLVDLNRIAELQTVDWVNGHVRIGAMTRQHVLEADPVLRERLPMLSDAARYIAHIAIRMRGTVGGSLAHADPAAELPAAALVLGATLIVRDADSGVRRVPAREFFLGLFTTALAEGELLEAVEIPVPAQDTGWGFVEVARVHGAFALAGAAAVVEPSGGRLAVFGASASPYMLELGGGESPDAVAARVRDEIEPMGDIHAGPDYRRRVAGVVAARALAAAEARR